MGDGSSLATGFSLPAIIVTLTARLRGRAGNSGECEKRTKNSASGNEKDRRFPSGPTRRDMRFQSLISPDQPISRYGGITYGEHDEQACPRNDGHGRAHRGNLRPLPVSAFARKPSAPAGFCVQNSTSSRPPTADVVRHRKSSMAWDVADARDREARSTLKPRTHGMLSTASSTPLTRHAFFRGVPTGPW